MLEIVGRSLYFLNFIRNYHLKLALLQQALASPSPGKDRFYFIFVCRAYSEVQSWA